MFVARHGFRRATVLQEFTSYEAALLAEDAFATAHQTAGIVVAGGGWAVGPSGIPRRITREWRGELRNARKKDLMERT